MGDSRVGLGPAEKYTVVVRGGRKENERGGMKGVK